MTKGHFITIGIAAVGTLIVLTVYKKFVAPKME